MEKASKTNNYHYNKSLQKYANENRKTMTIAAAAMWKNVLSKRQMKGYQFRRERPILNYIADFVCLELLLLIEVDGFTHDDLDQAKKDNIRDESLKEIGFTTLRFSSWEVLKRINDVGILIGDWIEEYGKVPPPSPTSGGNENFHLLFLHPY